MRRALLLVVLVAGCSFPEPTITDEPFDSSVDSFVAAETSADAVTDSSLDETTSDATTDGEVSTDAVADGDARDAKPSVCETANMCDCDGDGDEAKRTGCSGNDCDDGDKNRNSKVASFLDLPVTGLAHAGDWDCSGGVTREYGDTAVNCSALALSGCGGKTGYAVGSPTCGTVVPLVRCKSNGITCSEDTRTNISVKCK